MDNNLSFPTVPLNTPKDFWPPPKAADLLPPATGYRLIVFVDCANFFNNCRGPFGILEHLGFGHAITGEGIHRTSGGHGHVGSILCCPASEDGPAEYEARGIAPKGAVFDYIDVKFIHHYKEHTIYPRNQIRTKGLLNPIKLARLLCYDMWKLVASRTCDNQHTYFDMAVCYDLTKQEYENVKKGRETRRKNKVPYHVTGLRRKGRNCVREVDLDLQNAGKTLTVLSRFMPWPWTYTLAIRLGKIFGPREGVAFYIKSDMRSIMAAKGYSAEPARQSIRNEKSSLARRFHLIGRCQT